MAGARGAALNRRAFLAGAAGLGLPARAATLPRDVRPDPDFGRLRAIEPRLVGVRPHRTGGVRLELEVVAGKALVHHYGHGGAGITLAFGGAEEAADLVDRALARVEAPSVAVLGTGVVGLASAAAIRRRRPTVPLTIYAKDLDLRTTTSWVAGGQFEPSGIWREHTDDAARARLEGWLAGSRARIRALAPSWERYGICARERFVPDPAGDASLPFARLTGPARLSRTWLLEPPRLLPALAADLASAGVRFRARTFASLADVVRLAEPVVVNCTGYGARDLCRDERLVPQRGHLVALERPSERHDYLFDGASASSTTYVFCRLHDIVVGGTVIPGDELPTAAPRDDVVFAKILADAAALFAGRQVQP